MKEFDKYFSYQLIPKEFNGTIVASVETDADGNPVLDVETIQKMFYFLQENLPNAKLLLVTDTIQLKGV